MIVTVTFGVRILPYLSGVVQAQTGPSKVPELAEV